MKRLIAAVAFALCAAPAIADMGAPFEQNELDRTLPSLPENLSVYDSIASEHLPFEQTQFDRGYLAATPERVVVAQVGSTSYKSGASEGAESVWEKDHNFIAPPQ
jgi:hypothetical protein